jgi:hypothetical protein
MSSADGAIGFGPKGIVYAKSSHFDPSENKCGICLHGGAAVKWLNPSSDYAHRSCLDYIQTCLDLISKKVEELFNSPETLSRKEIVKIEALKALNEVLEGSSMLQVAKSQGIDKLAILIINVSLPVIANCYKKLS